MAPPSLFYDTYCIHWVYQLYDNWLTI